MKLFEMLVEIVEIDLCICSSTRSQTLSVSRQTKEAYFVVFHPPFLVIGSGFFPELVFRHSEEGDIIVAFGDSDDRRNEFDEETGNGK